MHAAVIQPPVFKRLLLPRVLLPIHYAGARSQTTPIQADSLTARYHLDPKLPKILPPALPGFEICYAAQKLSISETVSEKVKNLAYSQVLLD